MTDYLDAVLADALEDTDQTATYVRNLDEQLREQASPAILSGADPERNPIINAMSSMELLFASLEERGIANPGKLSEYGLYKRLEHFRRPAKE